MIHRFNDTTHTRGHTLLEMTLSLLLLSVLMVSVGSAMLFAAKAAPSDDSPSARLLRDAKIMSRIAEDLFQAKYVLESNPHAVTIVVADRTGDMIPDRIRYAWSGSPGDALTYQLNNATPVPILNATGVFTLEYDYESNDTLIPSPMVFGAERLIASHEVTLGFNGEDVDPDTSHGQLLSPILSLGALGFMPTRIELYGRRNNPIDGTMLIELSELDSGAPGDRRFASASVSEADLGGSFAWNAFRLIPEQFFVPAGESLALSMGYTAGTDTVAQLASSVNVLGGQIVSEDGGASWSSIPGQSMLYRLYGQEVSDPGTDIVFSHEHIVSITIELDSSLNETGRIARSVRLLQSPEVLDRFWEASFDVSPTRVDLDNDATMDWSYVGAPHIPAGDLANGIWTARSTLTAQPSSVFNKPATVDVRFCTAGVSRAVVLGPLHVDANGDVLPVMMVLRSGGTGVYELAFYNDLAESTPYGVVPIAGEGMVDVRLIVLPNSDTVALWVNGDFIGSAIFNRRPDNGLRGFQLYGQGNQAKFADVRVAVGGSVSGEAVAEEIEAAAASAEDPSAAESGATADSSSNLLNQTLRLLSN